MPPPTRRSTREQQTVTPADAGRVPLEMIPAPADLVPGAHQNPAAALFLAEAKGPRNEPAKIPIIGIDHRSHAFVLPSAEVVESIAGYPIYYFQTRRFYLKPPQPGVKGQPPDCWSANLLTPHQDSLDKQAETCAECPNNQFGTARDGRSKACGTFTWVFLLNPAFGSPPLGVVVAPPSSIRELMGTRFKGGYFSQAAARGGVYEIVWTTFRLRPEGTEQLPYSVLEPHMGEVCTDPDRVRQIAQVRNQFIAMMDDLRGMTPQVASTGEGG